MGAAGPRKWGDTMHEDSTRGPVDDPGLSREPFPPSAPTAGRTLTRPMIAALVVLALLMVGVVVAAVLAVVQVREASTSLAGSASSARVTELPESAVPPAAERDWANPAWLGTFVGDTDTGRYTLTFTDDDPVTGLLHINNDAGGVCRMSVQQTYRINESSVVIRMTSLAGSSCRETNCDVVVNGDTVTMIYRSVTYILTRA